MTTPIDKISGIGLHTAGILVEYGYKCAEDLAATNEDALRRVPGFGPARAKLVIKAARVLCDFKSLNSGYSQNISAATETIEKTIVGDKTAVDKAAVDHLDKKNKSKKKSKKKKKNKEEKKSKKENKQKKEKKAEKVKKSASKKKKKKDN